MDDHRLLRPLERRVLRLVHNGVDDTEIARRFRRGPEFVGRVVAYTRMPRTGSTPEAGGLRPVERRILKWRAGGADYADIGRRFRRSAAHIERIEQLAAYKLQAS
jgi:DNA-binding CsgD family transcriptional regulator